MYTINVKPGETMDQAVRRGIFIGYFPQGAFASGDPTVNGEHQFKPNPRRKVVGIVKPNKEVGFYVYAE